MNTKATLMKQIQEINLFIIKKLFHICDSSVPENMKQYTMIWKVGI